METFADYILSEEETIRKMEIVYYLQKKTGIFYDNSVILKTQIARLFIEVMKIPVDKNLVVTACLLCSCKKMDGAQNLEKIRSYAKESADFLRQLGFSKRFCRICEQHNRYSGSEPREKESDILELADQFGGMLMNRPERIAFKADEALCLLENRNLKDKNNRYLEQFKEFCNKMKEVRV
jgi:hypothetical protein